MIQGGSVRAWESARSGKTQKEFNVYILAKSQLERPQGGSNNHPQTSQV